LHLDKSAGWLGRPRESISARGLESPKRKIKRNIGVKLHQMRKLAYVRHAFITIIRRVCANENIRMLAFLTFCYFRHKRTDCSLHCLIIRSFVFNLCKCLIGEVEGNAQRQIPQFLIPLCSRAPENHLRVPSCQLQSTGYNELHSHLPESLAHLLEPGQLSGLPDKSARFRL